MIRWQCECGRAMAVKAEHAGKRVKCPNCETVQMVPQEQSEDDFEQGVAERPRRVAASPMPHERVREREPVPESSAGSWVWLSLAAVLLLAIGGVALWFFVLRDGAGQGGAEPLSAASVQNLKLVPADAPAVGTVALGKWWNGPHAKAYRESFAKFQSEYFQNTKSPLAVQPNQIERVTFAMDGRTGNLIYFITTNEPIDPSQVTKSMGPTREKSVNGKVVHEGRGTAVHFIDKQTFVVGDRNSLNQYLSNPLSKNAFDHGPLQSALAATDKHLAVFSINTDADLFRKIIAEMERRPHDAANKIALPLARAKSGLITLDITDELDLKLRLSYANEADAKQALAAATDALQMGRGLLKGLRATVEKNKVPAMVEILTHVDSILNSAVKNQNGNDVELALHVDKKGFEQITSNWVDATKEAITKVRGAARRIEATNNFRQLGIALHSYADTRRNQLPPHAIYSKDGKPLLSWRVSLLPFVEGDLLYRKFHLNEPWDSPHNIKLLSEMPKVYELPGHIASKPGYTFIQVFTGPKTIFEGAKPRFNIVNIPDGSSNTIFTVEAAKAVPWTKPADIPYSPQVNPRTQLGNHYGEGTIIGLFDGSIYTIRSKVSEETLRNAIMPADGNVLTDW